MPRNNGPAMKTLRDSRRSAGLVEFRKWVKPATKKALGKLADKLEKKN